MNEYITFSESKKFKIAILIKDADMVKTNLLKHYVEPLVKLGLSKDDIIVFPLSYDGRKKPNVKTIKSTYDDILPKLSAIGVTHVLCCDSDYFKTLARVRKTPPYHGYAIPVMYPEESETTTILCSNYVSLFYQPTNQGLIDTALKTLTDSINGTYREPGNIIHSASYPDNTGDIKRALKDLHQYPELSCDIETFSLKIDEAGLGSISFAWDEYNGIAFAIEHDNPCSADIIYIKDYLIEFFSTYTGKLTYHGGAFDLKVLIYELWMDNIDDTVGLLKGLDILTKNIDDTMIIAYLATNTTAGNKLSLKELSQKFTGNYAQENIKNIILIPQPQLLSYNLTDCLATNWVKNKYYPILINNKQEKIYKEIYLPAMKMLIQTELTGFALDMDEVLEAEKTLNNFIWMNQQILDNSPYINNFKRWLQHTHRVVANAKLKKKVKPYSDFPLEFNAGSSKQVGQFLHEFMNLNVIDTTDTGLPATGNDALNKLMHQADEETTKILNAIMDITSAEKIVNTFIKAFKERSILHSDGLYYLHGNFKLGGTVSSRISSNSPNLMNLPSTSIYAKTIKKCFISPPGQILVGSDFNALESRISALLTKDPMFESVYTQGFDSHALNSYFYFKDQMPDIVKELDGYFD